MKIPVSRPWLIASAALVLLGGGVGLVAALGDKPAALEDLERAQSAGEEAGANTAEIIANLEEIAGNIEEGAQLSRQSEEIHSLTEKQRDSLAALI